MALYVPPFGFHFLPTKEELLCYLLIKVTGRTLPCNVVVERDLYGSEEPWALFPPESEAEVLYFFTRNKKVSTGKKNVKRTAGCGTWKLQQTKEIKDSTSTTVATKTLLSFQGKDGVGDGSTYTMNEYALKPSDPLGFVVCKVKRKLPKGSPAVQPPSKRLCVSCPSFQPMTSTSTSATDDDVCESTTFDHRATLGDNWTSFLDENHIPPPTTSGSDVDGIIDVPPPRSFDGGNHYAEFATLQDEKLTLDYHISDLQDYHISDLPPTIVNNGDTIDAFERAEDSSFDLDANHTPPPTTTSYDVYGISDIPPLKTFDGGNHHAEFVTPRDDENLMVLNTDDYHISDLPHTTVNNADILDKFEGAEDYSFDLDQLLGDDDAYHRWEEMLGNDVLMSKRLANC